MRSVSRLVLGVIVAGLLVVTSAGTAAATTYAAAPPQVPAAAAIPPSCNINDNLGLTADQFISRCVRASVRGEFPSQLYGATVQNIRDNRSLNDDYKKAWKLISQSRFRK